MGDEGVAGVSCQEGRRGPDRLRRSIHRRPQRRGTPADRLQAGETVWSPESSIERLIRDYKCSSVLCWVDAPLFDPKQPGVPVPGGDQLLRRLGRWPGSTVWLASGERPTGKSSAFAEALRASLGETPQPLLKTLSELEANQGVKELKFRQVGGVPAEFSLFRDRFQPPRKPKLDLLVQKGHASRISALAIRADGQSMVTASEDSTIRIWNPSSPDRALLRVLPEFLNGVTAMALSPDGRYVAGGDGMGEVIAWDLAGIDPRPIVLNGPKPHDNLIKAMSFLPEDPAHRGPASTRFVTIGQDDRCVVWDLNGRELTAWPAPMSRVRNLLLASATRPGGSASFVVIGDDGSLRSFDRSARATRPSIPVPGKRPTALQLDPEGKWAAVGLEDGRVKVFDLETRKVLLDLEPLDGPVSSLKIGPGKLLAVGSEGSVALVSIDDPKGLTRLEAGNSPVESIEFSSDGGWLAACTRLGDLLAWKLEAGKAPIAMKLDRSGGGLAEFACLGFGPSSVSPILVAGENDGGIRRWDLKGPKELPRLGPHRGKVRQVGATADGRRLLQITEEGIAQVWDLREGRNVRTLAGRWASGAFLPDGRLALARHPNQGGGLVVVDSTEGRPVAGVNLARPARDPGDYGRVIASRDGRQVAASAASGRDELVQVWDLANSSVRTIASPHNRPITSIDFSSDGRTLLTAGEDGLVKLWNLDALGEIKATIAELKAPRIDSISAASLSKDGPWRIIAAGLTSSDEPRAFCWELRPGGSPSKARFVSLGPTPAKMLAATVLAGGRFVALGGRDRRLLIWELAEGREPEKLGFHASPDHTESINDLIAWPRPGDGLTLVSGSDDTTIRFWRIEPGSKSKKSAFQLLGTLTSAPDETSGRPDRAPIARIDAPWVAFTPDGVYDASLDGERLVTFADGRKVNPLDQYATRLFHPLLTGQFLEGVATPPKPYNPPPPLLIKASEDRPASQGEVEIKVVLGDPGLDVRSLRLYQNDAPVRDDSNFEKAANPGEFVTRIKLHSGHNRLYAMAGRRDDIDARSPDLDLYHSGLDNPGRMHVLALGVANYTRNALLYPVDDANQLADYLARQGVGAGKAVGQRILLKDDAVTPKSVREAFATIRKEVKGHPEDTVVVFLAGHTDVLTTPDKQSLYSLLLPNFPFPETDPARAVLRGTGVAAEIPAPDGAYLPYALIYRDLTSLDAIQRLVIVDACQAAAVLDDPGVRLVEQLKAMDREARPSRTSYFLASRRGEPAGEPPVLKHGLLTYVLLQGMGAPGLAPPPANIINPFVENPTADLDGDGTITTRELRRFVDLTMPRLAETMPNRLRTPRPLDQAKQTPREPQPFDDPRLSANGPSFPLITVPPRPSVAAAEPKKN